MKKKVQHKMSLQMRIKRLEALTFTLNKRFTKLSKRWRTVYHLLYHRTVRRKQLEQQALNRIMKWNRDVERQQRVLRTVGILHNSISKGRHVLTLDNKQYSKLNYILKKDWR